MNKESEEFVEQALSICDKSSQFSNAVDKDKVKKLEKLRKKAVQTVFDSNNHKYFNIKFLIQWMSHTYNFSFWKQ